MLTISRAIRPDDFEIFLQIPGVALVARDMDFRMFWCSERYYLVPGVVMSVEDMMGTKLSDSYPPSAAAEREAIFQRVMDTGEPESHYQLSSDSRIFCTVMPLDERAFGHRGIFAVVKDARIEPMTLPHGRFPVLSTPVFKVLGSLTLRELEVLYHLAVGLSTREIAKHVCRADKTIEHHINSIHGKLGTHSRAQLVNWASERGIQAFSDEEWASIVAGARLVRRE